MLDIVPESEAIECTLGANWKGNDSQSYLWELGAISGELEQTTKHRAEPLNMEMDTRASLPAII